jgi:hypothetical protein
LIWQILPPALLALVVWALVKAFRNYRNGGDPGWKAYDQGPDGPSRSDKITSFLKYPWSK